MGRIMGIDYGNKRIGIAISDPLGIFASPLLTTSPAEFESFLADYLKKESVESFVVGYPVMMNNEPSESVKYIDPFIKRLKKLYPGINVHLADERFTTKMAHDVILMSGTRKKDRQDKTLADRVSAAIILQSHLDNKIRIKTANQK